MSLGTGYSRTPIEKEADFGKLGYMDYFLSEGKRELPKVIQFAKMEDKIVLGTDRKLFNLALLDIIGEKLSDQQTLNNDDEYKIFDTVLASIPAFFQKEPDVLLRVAGSDSSPAFVMECKKNCQKPGCEVNQKCIKQGQRIRIYQRYLKTNHIKLSSDYKFYGGINVNWVNDSYHVEDYDATKDYEMLLFEKI